MALERLAQDILASAESEAGEIIAEAKKEAKSILDEAKARAKSILDRQYSCQDLLRKWLLLHVPLSIALIIMSIWHLIMIHLYLQ